MLALAIIAGILLFMLLVLFIAVHVYISNDNESGLSVKVRYLFLTFKIYPLKEKKKVKKVKKIKKVKKVEKKPKEKEKKEGLFKELFSGVEDILEEEGILGVIDYLRGLFQIASRAFKRVFASIIIKKLKIYIIVANDDASKTAINYGKICAGLYPSLAILQSFMKVRKTNVVVEPNFFKEKTETYINLHLYFRPLRIIWTFVRMGASFIWYNIKTTQDETEDNPNNPRSQTENIGENKQ